MSLIGLEAVLSEEKWDVAAKVNIWYLTFTQNGRQLVVFVFVFTREELEHLIEQIQTLEERIKPARPEPPSVSSTSPEDSNISQAETSLKERGELDAGGPEEQGGGEGLPGEESKRERASAVIQRSWREHRERVCRRVTRNEGMKQKWSLSTCVSLHEGHGDAAVSVQRPPQQRVAAPGSAGRPGEAGFSSTNAPHGGKCRSNQPQHSGGAAGCGRPDAHPVGVPGTPGSLHTWNEQVRPRGVLKEHTHTHAHVAVDHVCVCLCFSSSSSLPPLIGKASPVPRARSSHPTNRPGEDCW